MLTSRGKKMTRYKDHHWIQHKAKSPMVFANVCFELILGKHIGLLRRCCLRGSPWNLSKNRLKEDERLIYHPLVHQFHPLNWSTGAVYEFVHELAEQLVGAFVDLFGRWYGCQNHRIHPIRMIRGQQGSRISWIWQKENQICTSFQPSLTNIKSISLYGVCCFKTDTHLHNKDLTTSLL